MRFTDLAAVWALSLVSVNGASPEWTAAYTKARTAVARLSLAQKVSLATGVGWQNGNCVGNTPAISTIAYPGLCLGDGPLGVRFADLVSVFPAEITVAATFNRTLMRQRAAALGAEFRGKGMQVALAPGMNLMRAPAGGRGWEGFGSDGYLSGEASYETVLGIQSNGVQATAKHYINNEQEHFRETSSSNVDDRTQHEVYLLPFLRSVQANVAAVMCSYNQINGSFACQNDKMLNGILKQELGFQGYVMSDWAGTHSTTAVNQGLDMTMPGDISFGSGTTYFGANLTAAVNNGQVSQTRIDDLALRILAAWYLVGQDSGFPAVNVNVWNLSAPVNTHVNVQSNHKSVIREIANAGTVLLKNSKSLLPLKTPQSLAIIGTGARANSRGMNGCTDRGCNDGVLAQGWGSGTAEYPYLVTPLDAITTKASSIGATVTPATSSDTNLTAAATAATGKTAALVFITADSGEGYITVENNVGDRNNLQAWHSGDNLVTAVARVNPNTIVVVNSVGPILMESWIDNVNVSAVVYCGLPGQEAGNSLTDILWGAYNPSGRLPFTIGKLITDYSAQVVMTQNGAITPIPYSDGIFIDYRHFDKNNITPRFPFGFGLSFTNFSYTSLTVSGSIASGTGPSGAGSSVDSSLHQKVITVTFSIQNAGSVAGHEIPQLYVSLPSSVNAPVRALKGFDSVFLTAGQTKSVTIQLSRFDLSYWNVITQTWYVPSGTISLSVGASSRDLRLTGSLVAS